MMTWLDCFDWFQGKYDPFTLHNFYSNIQRTNDKLVDVGNVNKNSNETLESKEEAFQMIRVEWNRKAKRH